MFVAIIVVHVIVSISLVGAILLHSGRGTGLSGAFGGGGGLPTSFSGTTMIEKNLDRLTIVLVVIFALTSMALAKLS